jgi:hypothetical protein
MLKRQPRIGERILFPNSKNDRTDKTMVVTHFDANYNDDICYGVDAKGHEDCFIWRFSDGLNTFAVNLDDND